MIDNNNIEKHIIKNINDNIDYIAKHSDLLILYDKELYDNELYINIRIYDTNTKLLLKNRFDKLIHIYNFILGVKSCLQFFKG